ncbi:hypothetical protein EDB97_11638 [Agrobacterium tumefaciens]|nr:hypothetical protein EDB97_11638 [Agrobacterium tumefaciens]
MKTVCETTGVARSNIAARAAGSPSRSRGRPPLPDQELVEEIKAIIPTCPPTAIGVSMPSCVETPRMTDVRGPNAKHVYRVMKLHNLLLVRPYRSGR